MNFFVEGVVNPFIVDNRYVRICEIGARHGDATRTLRADVTITTIDPCIDEDLVSKFKADPRVTVRRGLSLDVLDQMSEGFDCYLIDGDHNWYTVFNELKTIDEKNLLRPGGAILLHDVRWPYARRDMYYDPSTIPPEYTRPYARRRIVKGQSALSTETGPLNNALVQGGPRNGVLTAIEDFLALNSNSSKYIFMKCPVEHGLGVLVSAAPGIDMSYRMKWRFRLLRFAAKSHLLQLKYALASTFEHQFPGTYRLLAGLKRRID